MCAPRSAERVSSRAPCLRTKIVLLNAGFEDLLAERLIATKLKDRCPAVIQDGFLFAHLIALQVVEDFKRILAIVGLATNSRKARRIRTERGKEDAHISKPYAK